jgi:hypothetical protein
MLKLLAPDNAFRDGYGRERLLAFEYALQKLPVCANTATMLPWANDFLDYLYGRLNRLAIGKPHILRQEIEEINKHKNFGIFGAYCRNRPTAKSGKRDIGQEALLTIVEKLFSYKKFCDSPQYGGYALMQLYNQRICPYCQMHHINFYIGSGFKLRPALDHFYPESKYPYLGVSLFNLVPACEQCNSRVKLAKDPLSVNLANPFDHTKPIGFRSGWNALTTLEKIGTAADFRFSFQGTSPDSIAFADFFYLGKRYGWYSHELLDMARRYQRFMDLDPGLRKAIDPVEYLLSFAIGVSSERMIGVLLVDAARCMVAAYGTSKPPVDISA